MATVPASVPPNPAGDEPTIHEAERASGPSGAVEGGPALTVAEAVQRRKDGSDIVVRGPNQGKNRQRAQEIETAVGTPITHDVPHARAGPLALPHFHQVSRDPDGHSFYELGNRKAKRKR